MKGFPPRHVSVGILCFNQEAEIPAVIESALAQTRPADEVLVVDDGSTDRSAQIVASFPGVRLIRHLENRGRAVARTTLLHNAIGDVIVYLDGDNPAAPNLVEELLSAYTDPTVAVVCSIVEDTSIFSEWDRWRATHVWPKRRRGEDASGAGGCGMSCRRDLALELIEFRPGGEDYDFCYRLSARGYQIVEAPQARVRITRRDSASSLCKMLFRWASGGYVAAARNGESRLTVQLARLARVLVWRLAKDLIGERDLGFAAISMVAAVAELLGLIDGWFYVRSGERRTLVRGF